MKSGAKLFWVAVAMQALFLLGWAGYHEVIRQRGPVITLRARPVDPQDILRGDYLTLRYDIGQLPAVVPEGIAQGSSVWVVLRHRGRHHEIVRVSLSEPVVTPGEIAVRGTARTEFRGGGTVNSIEYGIEKFFVGEGRGNPRFEELEVEVAVNPAHRLFIKRVLLDGTPFR